MKASKIFKRAFVCLGLLATMTSLTGCANNIVDRSNALSDNLVQVCAEYNEEDYGSPIVNFELIGADVNKTSFDFDVNFNGVASHENNDRSFTSVCYEVPSTYFEDVKKSSSTDAIYDIFDKIVAELDPVSINVSKVSNLSATNNAFISNEVSPFAKYHISDGMLYNLGTPVFDDVTNSVSFDTTTLVELKSRKVQPGFGLGIGFNGHVGLGFGIFITPREGTFTLKDNYSFTVDEETYNVMKNDHALVYDYCAKAINDKDSSKIKAERISTTSVEYDNSNVLDRLGIKDLEEGLSK